MHDLLCIFHIPISMPVTLSPGISVYPCTGACNLFKKVIINIPKLCTKIGKVNAHNKIDNYNMDGMVINEHNW